jgi:hypothetical protein
MKKSICMTAGRRDINGGCAAIIVLLGGRQAKAADASTCLVCGMGRSLLGQPGNHSVNSQIRKPMDTTTAKKYIS